MDEEDTDIIEEVSLGIKDKKNAKAKICFICESNKAEFCIKDVPEDCYCKECAIDAFGDVDCLERL
jgi:hypothetical protein